MTLAQAWRRRLFGGVATAAFAPAALVLALVALAFSGGFGRLGALAQAFAGPASPPASIGVAARPLAAPVLKALASAAATPSVTRRAHTRTRVVSGPRSRAVRTPVRSTAPPGVGAPSSPRRPSAGSSPAPTPSPSAPPSHHSSVVDRIVGTATGVTSKLPAPAGPAATQTLQTLGSTLDQVLPPPGHSLP